jgi:zinc protease
MNRILRGALLLLMLLPALPAHAVKVERVTSPGGIEAWLVRDHTNPIIALDIAFDGGTGLEPEEKAGVGYFLAGLLDEGAGPHDSFAFQQMLEDNAIRMGFDIGKDYFRGSLKTLSENRDQAFELFRLALAEPRLDPEPISRVRSQIMIQLARDQQSPDSTAAREWYEAAFPGHHYGRPTKGTPDTVKSLTNGDLRAFALAQFGRDALKVGVVGDVTPEQLGPALDKMFGGLPAKAMAPPAKDVVPVIDGKVRVIERGNPQSVVMFGGEGIKRSDPEWFPAYVMNYILGGGGFSSRLTEEIREKRGLAYSVYSYLSPLDNAGVIIGGVATENSRVAASLDLIRQEWQRMAQEGPTQEELDNAKTYLTGSYPLQLESTSSIAQTLVQIQLEDLGIDYLDRRNGMVEAVTLEQAHAAARRLLDPARLSFVVVGKPEGLESAR